MEHAEHTTENAVELSVVIPCLNEAETVGSCIAKAQQVIRDGALRAEIVVADNGSRDGSVAIAEEMGARVVHVAERGYGSALMGGIAAARGTYVVMGDADDSYDFSQIPVFVERLREGYDLVQGCRLPAGGGVVRPGAMPLLHRWLGNPLLSLLARGMFRTPIRDVYCGMRGFRRDHYLKLNQRCTGMEFAVEMIVKSSLHGAKITEVPITLHPDGRRSHVPHLRTFRDGWRTVRFLLMCSPRWLFLLPGLALISFGVLGYAVALPSLTIGGINFDAHTLLFASLAILCGHQAVTFAVLSKAFASEEGLLPRDPRLEGLSRRLSLERVLLVAAAAVAIGIVLLLIAVNQWRIASFGHLDYRHTMRWVVPGVTLTALGFQTIFAAFFASILHTRRR